MFEGGASTAKEIKEKQAKPTLNTARMGGCI